MSVTDRPKMAGRGQAGGDAIRRLTAVLLAVVLPLGGCALLEKRSGEKSECSRIADLAAAGDFKPAVDAARKLEESGGSCAPEIAEAVSAARAALERADAHVHKALKRRKEGNLLSARANLQLALEDYPRYYWVQNLMRNVGRAIHAELDSLRNEAGYFESIGDTAGALLRLQEALRLAPGDPALRSETARLGRLISRKEEEKKVRAVLDDAASLLEEGRFGEAQRLLTRQGSGGEPGPRAAGLLAEIKKRREETIDRRFAVAMEMEKKGDLETAAGHATYVLELLASGHEKSEKIVEFSRLLGMKLYSAGQLSMAREVWEKAFAVDPDNLKLAEYLTEVETRLDSLDRIKRGGSDSGGE